MAAFHRHEFPWPALPFTVGLSSVDIYVTALRRLYWKILMATIFCVLWMVMRLSWPSLICLLLSVSLTIFSFTDFNLSTAFPASSFRGLNLDLLVRSHCDCQQQVFKTCSYWSYPLIFLLCSSLLFDWNTLCPNQSFADDTQLLQSCLFWSDVHTPVLTMQACIFEMKAWITQSKLKLRNDTTKALLMKSNRIFVSWHSAHFSSWSHCGNSFHDQCLQPWFHDFRHFSWQLYFWCLLSCLRGNQTGQLYPPLSVEATRTLVYYLVHCLSQLLPWLIPCISLWPLFWRHASSTKVFGQSFPP